MRAVILDSPRSLRVGDWSMPRPGAGEVLIKVEAAGVCVGDLLLFQGRNPYAKYPQICCHEVCGVVSDIGKGVTGVALGDRVVVEPFVGCGTCFACKVGRTNCCDSLNIIGVNRPGGFAEFVTAPASHVHAVPAGLSPLQASLAEPVAIGVHACRRGQVQTGDLVLVMGCGPIGFAAIEVALARGATVIATDLMPERLEAAAQVGAETMLADEHLKRRLLDRTSGQGVPVIMEATGSPAVMSQALDLLSHAGRLVILGLVKDGLPVSFNGLDLTRKEPTIVGSRASKDAFPEALSLIKNGQISLHKLVSAQSLWDSPKIFPELELHPSAHQKIVLVP
jgi:L-gulonate 5-dehydrogenase